MNVVTDRPGTVASTQEAERPVAWAVVCATGRIHTDHLGEYSCVYARMDVTYAGAPEVAGRDGGETNAAVRVLELDEPMPPEQPRAPCGPHRVRLVYLSAEAAGARAATPCVECGAPGRSSFEAAANAFLCDHHEILRREVCPACGDCHPVGSVQCGGGSGRGPGSGTPGLAGRGGDGSRGL